MGTKKSSIYPNSGQVLLLIFTGFFIFVFENVLCNIIPSIINTIPISAIPLGKGVLLIQSNAADGITIHSTTNFPQKAPSTDSK